MNRHRDRLKNSFVRRCLVSALLVGLVLAMAPSPGGASSSFTSVSLSDSSFVLEPGIDVSSDGRIFVNGIEGLPGHSRVWRSDDGGRRYAELGFQVPYSLFPGGGDADVALAPGGRVYFIDLWAGSSSFAMSRDNGRTWSQGTPISTLPLTDRPWIAVGNRDASGNDTIYAVYHLLENPSMLMFARSGNGGLTWTSHRPAPQSIISDVADPGQLVANGSFLAFPYVVDGTLYLARSSDAGATFERVVIPGNGHVFDNLNGLALYGSSMYVSWIDARDFSVWMARSTDRGGHWSRPLRVSRSGSSMFPWIAARGSKVAVAWYGANLGGDPDKLSDAARWSVKYAESLDGGRRFSSPVAATGTVKLGRICVEGFTCDLSGSGGREFGDFLQVALDLHRKSLISYVNVVAGSAAVVKQK